MCIYINIDEAVRGHPDSLTSHSDWRSIMMGELSTRRESCLPGAILDSDCLFFYVFSGGAMLLTYVDESSMWQAFVGVNDEVGMKF